MISKGSPEWPGIRTWLEEQIETKRDMLESKDCGIKEADLHRGRILAFREMIEAVDPKPKPEMTIVPFVKGAGY